ncbi:MAG TPA: plastocyanin/azurin family copper-binding protein [Candidatus Dormibacteraeota bacterium]|nr:plastocyanin/azurin family copper-binding protein [Candidatus Dormibacteraeota bacterium]
MILRALGAGACVLALAACGDTTTGNNPGTSPASSAASGSPVADTTAVTIHVVPDPNDIGAFKPKDATAKVGDTVNWVFDDSQNSHTATSDDGAPDSFDSGTLAQGQSFKFKFTKAGKYGYHCNLHASMVGTITVS